MKFQLSLCRDVDVSRIEQIRIDLDMSLTWQNAQVTECGSERAHVAMGRKVFEEECGCVKNAEVKSNKGYPLCAT